MRLIAGKLIRLAIVLLLVTMVSFFMMNLLPGDPVTNFNLGANKQEIEQLRNDLNLDKPELVRYWEWLKGFATGDMGQYYGLGGKTPADVVRQGLPISITLMFYVQVLAVLIAVPLGALSAYRADSVFDRLSGVGAFLWLSVPSFILAYFLKRWFTIDRAWFPVRGWVGLFDNPIHHLRSAVLPTVSLTLGQVAVYYRLLRSDMIATLQEDFITMAKAKGISPRRVLFRHALRPSSLTLLTVAGLNVGTLIGGALIVEVIFGIPGIGTAIYEAIAARQYVALQSFVAIVAVIYVLVNFAVDFLYTVLDPRIRHV